LANRIKTTSASLIFLLAVLMLSSCSDAGARDPAETVEKYLHAKVESDVIEIRSLLCSKMEEFLERESNTFASVSGVRIDEMECSSEGDEGVVRCSGKIIALYGTEEQEFPLVSYQTVREAGEWKWCGEAPR
jgi:hypothetical protein